MKNFTHFDTESHGYLSVSKKDILKYGINPEEISQFSGMTFNRVYLEEDCDMNIFLKKLDDLGIQYKIRWKHNKNFSIHHNYKSKLFDYQPEEMDLINDEYLVQNPNPSCLIVESKFSRKIFKIPKSNPFNYIFKVEKTK